MDEAVNGIFSFFFLSHTIVQCIPLALPCLFAFNGVLIGFDQTRSNFVCLNNVSTPSVVRWQCRRRQEATPTRSGSGGHLQPRADEPWTTRSSPRHQHPLLPMRAPDRRRRLRRSWIGCIGRRRTSSLSGPRAAPSRRRRRPRQPEADPPRLSHSSSSRRRTAKLSSRKRHRSSRSRSTSSSTSRLICLRLTRSTRTRLNGRAAARAGRRAPS